jgi:hypothetical protein
MSNAGFFFLYFHSCKEEKRPIDRETRVSPIGTYVY